MIPTPRTDACTFHLALCNNDLPTDAVCPAEKMKELERENDTLRKALWQFIDGFEDHADCADGHIAGEFTYRDLRTARSVLEPAQPPAQKQ